MWTKHSVQCLLPYWMCSKYLVFSSITAVLVGRATQNQVLREFPSWCQIPVVELIWGPPTCWILSWHKAQTKSCIAAPWILYHLLERGSSLPGIYEQSAKTTRISFYLQPFQQHVEGNISRALHISPHWNVPTNMCLIDIIDINIPQKLTP